MDFLKKTVEVPRELRIFLIKDKHSWSFSVNIFKEPMEVQKKFKIIFMSQQNSSNGFLKEYPKNYSRVQGPRDLNMSIVCSRGFFNENRELTKIGN